MGDGVVYNTSRVIHKYQDIGVYGISAFVSNTISSVSLTRCAYKCRVWSSFILNPYIVIVRISK